MFEVPRLIGQHSSSLFATFEVPRLIGQHSSYLRRLKYRDLLDSTLLPYLRRLKYGDSLGSTLRPYLRRLKYRDLWDNTFLPYLSHLNFESRYSDRCTNSVCSSLPKGTYRNSILKLTTVISSDTLSSSFDIIAYPCPSDATATCNSDRIL